MKLLFLISFLTIVVSIDYDHLDSRKFYGLSNHAKCPDYIKTFKCLSACKSIGFQIFTMDKRCRCTCRELQRYTPLPFFKWRTNGSTRALIKTRSPSIYNVIGTLSARSTPKNITTDTTNSEVTTTPVQTTPVNTTPVHTTTRIPTTTEVHTTTRVPTTTKVHTTTPVHITTVTAMLENKTTTEIFITEPFDNSTTTYN